LDPEHERRRSLVAERSATPFRELSADEAAELNEVEEKAKGRRRKR